MPDVIICANYSVEKLRGLRNTRGQILGFPTLTTVMCYRAVCDLLIRIDNNQSAISVV